MVTKGQTRERARRRVEASAAHGVPNSLVVRGFKAFKQSAEVCLSPLTLLAGANSSGKSSVMQPLLLLKQTLEASFDPGMLRLDGPNVHFAQFAQLLWRGAKQDQPSGFSLVVRYGGATEGLNFRRNRLRGAFTADNGKHIAIEEGQPVPPATFALLRDELAGDPFRGARDVLTQRRRCSLVLAVRLFAEMTLPVFEPFRRLEETARRLLHVPGLRGNPQRTYRRVAPTTYYPGLFHEYVAGVIAAWASERNARLKVLNRHLSELGLTWKVDARPLDDTQVELRVGRLPTCRVRGGQHDLVSIADVGFGVSQVLPVLVALVLAEPGQMVYLEQPEIHLHPRAQVALASVLADAAKRGVVVVAETHSHLLLLGVQALVARGELAPGLVSLNWFQRAEDGSSVVTHADLDEQGAFGDWPQDFDDVTLETQRRLLDAAIGRRPRA